MSKKTCRDCLHCSVEGADEVYCCGMPWHYPFGGSDAVTLDKEACEHFLARDKPTIFARITESPAVLAEKLVYLARDSYNGATNYYWRSTIIDKAWKTKAEAIAATLERLKEVEK